jgi:hypothetical protein
MSRDVMKVTYSDDNGDEVEVELPSKNEVCGRCEGHGTHLNPSIGSYAYSAEEFDESFPTEEDKQEYFRRGGIYDVTCETCKGKSVVQVVNEEACTTEEQKEHLKSYKKHLEDQAEYERECRAERRMEAMMLGEYEYGYSDY